MTLVFIQTSVVCIFCINHRQLARENLNCVFIVRVTFCVLFVDYNRLCYFLLIYLLVLIYCPAASSLLFARLLPAIKLLINAVGYQINTGSRKKNTEVPRMLFY